MLKSNPQSNCPTPRPTARARPGVSVAPAALGALPGAPPTPAPPLCSKGSFLKPPPAAAGRPQECAPALGPPASPPDATHACMTQAVPPWVPPCRQPDSPSHLMQAGVPLAQGHIALHPKEAPPPLAHPLLLAKGPTCPLFLDTSLGCRLLPALCPPHPVPRLPAVTEEGIWYETKHKNQT